MTKQEYRARLDAEATQVIQPERKAAAAAHEKIERKRQEMDKLGVKGSEKEKQIKAETKAAIRELNRVRASNYTSPYNTDAR